jgi:hypothetical protein
MYYRDLRGSMAQFDPITSEQVVSVSNGTLTYTALSQRLAEYGLSIEKIVFDNNRPFSNAFYADFERALYCEIYLQMQNFEEGHRPLFRELERKCESGNERLAEQDWSSFYTIDVPLPMQAYDFQKRMPQIDPSQVFDVWMQIYKRLDYSNGGWLPETIAYVFFHAPKTEKPAPQNNGLVLLYRGMGELSQNAESAISWSTHPGNALWFANHSGRGTHLLLGEVQPENIVAYFPGFYYENEVLVLPGTVQNIRNADMLPATQEVFIKLAAPVLKEFIAFARQAQRFGYSNNKESLFDVHGIHHILRVLFLSLLYFHNSGDVLTEADKQVLIYFSILHDVARKHDGTDETHGDAAVKKIHRDGLRIKGIHLSKKDYRIAETIIRYHCRDDEAGIAAIDVQPGLSRREKERSKRLFCICKDMDGLDRVRFNGLDYRLLRTPYAVKLPLIAGCLLKEDILSFLSAVD